MWWTIKAGERFWEEILSSFMSIWTHDDVWRGNWCQLRRKFGLMGAATVSLSLTSQYKRKIEFDRHQRRLVSANNRIWAHWPPFLTSTDISLSDIVLLFSGFFWSPSWFVWILLWYFSWKFLVERFLGFFSGKSCWMLFSKKISIPFWIFPTKTLGKDL